VKRTSKGGSRGGFQWTLLEAAAVLSVTFSMFMVKEALSSMAWVERLGPSVQVPLRASFLALYYAAQIGMIVWLVRRRGGDVLAALGLRHASRQLRSVFVSGGLVIGGLVLTRSVASAYAFVTRELGLLPQSGTEMVTLFGNDQAGIVLAVVMVVLVGPVVEEAVFRGALQEGLAARAGMWPGIVFQAALFAAFHRSWWLLFPMFVLGVVLGWLAERTDSLWPPSRSTLSTTPSLSPPCSSCQARLDVDIP